MIPHAHKKTERPIGSATRLTYFHLHETVRFVGPVLSGILSSFSARQARVHQALSEDRGSLGLGAMITVHLFCERASRDSVVALTFRAAEYIAFTTSIDDDKPDA